MGTPLMCAAPPYGPKFSQFHAVKWYVGAPLRFSALATRNPGSAPGNSIWATRMHSSRICTARCSGCISCHGCPSFLPRMPPPLCHACPPLPHMPPSSHMPPSPCMPPFPHMPLCHAHSHAYLLCHAHPLCHACPPPLPCILPQSHMPLGCTWPPWAHTPPGHACLPQPPEHAPHEQNDRQV